MTNFYCNICLKEFTQKSHLNRHIKNPTKACKNKSDIIIHADIKNNIVDKIEEKKYPDYTYDVIDKFMEGYVPIQLSELKINDHIRFSKKNNDKEIYYRGGFIVVINDKNKYIMLTSDIKKNYEYIKNKTSMKNPAFSIQFDDNTTFYKKPAINKEEYNKQFDNFKLIENELINRIAILEENEHIILSKYKKLKKKYNKSLTE